MTITDAPPRGLLQHVRAARRLPVPAAARAIRVGVGVTQRQLADELDVDRVTVARWESGERSPRGELRLRYIELLEQLSALLHDERRQGRGGAVEDRRGDDDHDKAY